MTAARTPFAARLDVAARALAAPAPEAPPPGLADQVGALRTAEPDRAWHRGNNGHPYPDVAPMVLAALLGARICWHLRTGGPQPAILVLAEHRVTCRRCVATTRHLENADDQCDLCETTGIATFTPVSLGLGPLIVIGDVCDNCTTALRYGGTPNQDAE